MWEIRFEDLDDCYLVNCHSGDYPEYLRSNTVFIGMSVEKMNWEVLFVDYFILGVICNQAMQKYKEMMLKCFIW